MHAHMYVYLFTLSNRLTSLGCEEMKLKVSCEPKGSGGWMRYVLSVFFTSSVQVLFGHPLASYPDFLLSDALLVSWVGFMHAIRIVYANMEAISQEVYWYARKSTNESKQNDKKIQEY